LLKEIAAERLGSAVDSGAFVGDECDGHADCPR
jgi:hypothetical protein